MNAAARRRGVLCVGRLYCDLVFGDVPRLPTPGSEVFAGALSLHAGGGAVITAAHLADLGCPSHLAAFWPMSPFTETVARDVSGAGVGHSLCRAATASDPQITVAISGQSDRAFLTRRTGAAVPPIMAADLGRLNIGHLHIGELATLTEAPHLIDLARANGLTLSLDCSWDDATAAAAAALIARVDVFFPNAEEVAQLAGLGITAPFAPLTVIKQGATGARAVSRGRALDAPARKVSVVDTTGAGDAFNAGFLDRWLAGEPLAACLAAGNARGASAVQHFGGLPRAAALSDATA